MTARDATACERWQEMAEDLWDELMAWHTDDCPFPDTPIGTPDDACTCHTEIKAKWDEITLGGVDWDAIEVFSELDRLRQWQAEATAVILRWETVYLDVCRRWPGADDPHWLGRSKSEIVQAYIDDVGGAA